MSFDHHRSPRGKLPKGVAFVCLSITGNSLEEIGCMEVSLAFYNPAAASPRPCRGRQLLLRNTALPQEADSL